jgi:hypothetical protein
MHSQLDPPGPDMLARTGYQDPEQTIRVMAICEMAGA